MAKLLLNLLFWSVQAAFRSQQDLILENLALRQQLAVFKSKRTRPVLHNVDRAFWVAFQESWKKWKNVLIVVKPETVVRWHKEGFRRYWCWKSKFDSMGWPQIQREIRALIRQMAAENNWGAPRIHAELFKLGFRVSERTVSRYMPKKPAPPDALKNWMTFLKNHRDLIAGIDFFTIPTITFNVLYVFFIVMHIRRQIAHFAVTTHPCSEWVVQQLREAFPFDTAPKYLILDRDKKFGFSVFNAFKAMNIKPVRIAWKSPWQNGVAERWVLSVRRELLDHVVILNQAQLRRLLRDYVTYYNTDRCHLALEKDSPDKRPATSRPSPNARVIALPRVGGLHHRYEWRKAA
jgi:Integrase core domain.